MEEALTLIRRLQGAVTTRYVWVSCNASLHDACRLMLRFPFFLMQEPQDQAQLSGKTRGSGSGFAFSYDPQTSLAESYMSTHDVRQSASAMSDAEQRGRRSREDSRSSDYESSRSTGVVDSTKGSSSSGLFV